MTINFSDEKVIHTTNSIFLAGPTSRIHSYEQSWRKNAINILQELEFHGVVYIPEYGHGKFDQSKVEEQALWEREALESAGCVVFWVPRDVKGKMPAFTTNVEFGTYMQRKPYNVSFGYPEDADKMWYLDWLYHYELSNGKVFHSLKETLQNAIELTKHPNPIGRFYLSDDSVYQVVAYDKINDSYIAKLIDDVLFYKKMDEHAQLMSIKDILSILDERIEVANSNCKLYSEIYKSINDNDSIEFFSILRKLKTIKNNIRDVEFLVKYNPSLYEKHISRINKGYRRRLKRLYHFLGKENYERFIPVLEQSNYAEASYWKHIKKKNENRKKSIEQFIVANKDNLDFVLE